MWRITNVSYLRLQAVGTTLILVREMTSLRLDSRTLATSRTSNTQARRISQVYIKLENQLTIRLDILFAFAHLGMEIKMRRKPKSCIVSDYYATMTSSGAMVQPTPRASVASNIEAALIGVIPRGENLPRWKNMLQHLPIMGRLFAHFPGEYPCKFDVVKVLMLAGFSLLYRILLGGAAPYGYWGCPLGFALD